MIKIDELEVRKLMNCYLNQKMSVGEIARNSVEIIGKNASHATIRKLLLENKVSLRTISEQKSQLNNINESFLNEEMVEWVDGFLLGDGAINIKKQRIMKSGKILGCKFKMRSVQKEWSEYAMSKFDIYGKGETKCVDRRDEENCPNVFWDIDTLSHPDINLQMKRWYGQNPNYTKQIPSDIRITPVSLLLWYLGDGNLYFDKKNNTYMATFCTDSFSQESIKDILIPAFDEFGIRASITNNKKKKSFRIRFFAKNVFKFFEIIGKKSPINCYSYKFNIPENMYFQNVAELGLNNVDTNRIYHFLNRKGIYKKASNTKRWLLSPENIVAIKETLNII